MKLLMLILLGHENFFEILLGHEIFSYIPLKKRKKRIMKNKFYIFFFESIAIFIFDKNSCKKFSIIYSLRCCFFAKVLKWNVYIIIFCIICTQKQLCIISQFWFPMQAPKKGDNYFLIFQIFSPFCLYWVKTVVDPTQNQDFLMQIEYKRIFVR